MDTRSYSHRPWIGWLVLSLLIPWTFNQAALSAGERPPQQTAQDEPRQPTDQGDPQEKPAAEAAAPAEERAEDQATDGDDDEESKEDEGEDEEPIEVRCYFSSEEQVEIALRPLEWSAFTIEEVVAPGAEVGRGDTLIAFDNRKLDAAIEDLKQEIAQETMSLAQTEQSLELARRGHRMALEAAEREQRIASENLNRFLTHDRSERVVALEQSLRSAEDRLAYVQEEYNQLKQMYEADDLTEETEEIILRRTRDDVQNAEYSLERYRSGHDRGMQVEIPRNEESLERALREATATLERTRIATPIKEQQEVLALEKQRLGLERKKLQLKRLEHDRAQLGTIKSPITGRVYYGACQRGKWPDIDPIAATLAEGHNAKANQVLLTIAPPRPLRLIGLISESDLNTITVGTKATARPTADDDMELQVEVERISAVPVSDGKFLLEASISGLSDDAPINPGMTCQVVFERQVEEE